jgi:hypothetical protein
MAITRKAAAALAGSVLAAWLSATAHAQNGAPAIANAPPLQQANPQPAEIVTTTTYAQATPLAPLWQFHVDPFIMWYSGGNRFPALVTTGDPINDPLPGALGQPGTRVLRGGDALGNEGAAGLRLMLARTFGMDDQWSIDISGFMVATQSASSSLASDAGGNPVLVRPFFDPNTGKEGADYRSYPDYIAGTTYDSLTTRIYGAEANVRWDFLPITPTERLGFGMLVGARYFQLNEDYSNNDTSVDLPAMGTTNSFEYSDRIATRNASMGAQIGATVKWRLERFAFDVTGKLLGGNLAQSINIQGSTKFSDGNGTTAVDHAQGLYAMPSNIGKYTRDSFGVGGEVALKMGLKITENFRVNVGYTFFTMGNIVRPGDQIDRTINIQPLFSGGGVGVARPGPTYRETTFSTQMLNLGFEFLF